MYEFKVGDPYPEELYDQPYFLWAWPNRFVLVLPPGQADTVRAVDDGVLGLGLLPYKGVLFMVLRVGQGRDARYWHTPMANLDGYDNAPAPAQEWNNLLVCQTLNNDGELANLTITTKQGLRFEDEFVAEMQEMYNAMQARKPLSVEEFAQTVDEFEKSYPTGPRMWAACPVVTE